jgi:hypothetical protein
MPENTILRMMIKDKIHFLKSKIAICFSLVLISTQSLFSQIPDWGVKESEYQYTMTLVAKLNVDGKQLINPNDRVAAFVGTVCRGLSGLTYVASKKSYYAYLTVFANKQGESISFKLYDSANNKISNVSKTLTYVINEHKGDLFQSYSIAEPSLNSVADILSFNFMGVASLSSIMSNNIVSINISESFSLNALKPVFTLSKGASLFENRVLQTSGENIKNFSSAISYEVLSEDESTLKNFKVEVRQSIDPPLFYKKDAVCYAPGAIKIVSKREGSTVQITSNGKTLASKQIINGEALFSNLSAGSYIATIGNDWKLINILMKDK